MTGRSQIWDGAQWIDLSNNPGSKGDTGATGPPGTGGDVSSDAGNQAILGTDSLVYVPEFADGVYLKLSGGTMTGPITQANGTALLPSYAFANSPDAGMYRQGTGELGFSAAGLRRFSVSTTSIQGRQASGHIFLENGITPSETNPAYAFFGDIGTGMFRAGANQLGFSAGGEVKLTMTTTLNVFEHPIHVKEQAFGVAHYRLDDDAFRAQPVFDGTAGAAGNVFVTTGGVLLRSLAILFAASAPQTATMDTRIGQSFFDNTLEAIDLAALTNHILDLIDDLDSRVETLEP